MTEVRIVNPVLIEHLDQPPPEVLYHYTDQHGVLGIAQSGLMWASHVRYLNDRTEFDHAIATADALASARLAQATDDATRGELKLIRSAIAEAGINICVASWSSVDDDLSQWRAYGGNGTGYALAVAGSVLRDMARRQSFYLARCVYDSAEQERLLGELIDTTLAENLAHRGKTGSFVPDRPGGDMTYRMNRYGSLFKNPKFESEHEWRVVSMPLSRERVEYRVRAGRSTMIPYFEFSLLREDGRFAIEEACVGPCIDGENAKKALEDVLAKATGHYARPIVRTSCVPYRNW